jgi:hypothetical protein
MNPSDRVALRVFFWGVSRYYGNMDDNDQTILEETESRLQKILQGAFSGPPTPLKDVATRAGEKRAPVKRAQVPRKRRQRKNRAA